MRKTAAEILGVISCRAIIECAVESPKRQIQSPQAGKRSRSVFSFPSHHHQKDSHVSRAAISPDGKYLLQVHSEGGLQSLWLRHIATGSNAQVVAPAATRYQALTFSRDGSYLYFLRRDEEEHIIGILYAAPVLGGTPQVVARDVDSSITFSPDGQRFVFLREKHDSPYWDLIVMKSDGSDERQIFKDQNLLSDSFAPAWSPDGKTIVIPVVQPNKDALGGLVQVDAATGKITNFVASTRIFYEPVWMPDGQGLIIPSLDLGSGSQQSQLGYMPTAVTSCVAVA